MEGLEDVFMIYLTDEEAIQFHTRNTAIALGKFDGIHIGHQMLIDGLKQEQQKGLQALVFTFGDAPTNVLQGTTQKQIYTYDERAYYFTTFGIDVLLEYPFTKEFSALTPVEFVERILVKRLGVKTIYIGEDFQFGKGRSGNVKLLTQMGETYGFVVHAIPKKTLHDNVVSSTLIREYLENDLHLANELLGTPYFIYGEVVHGNHLGNTIGFPTINQKVDSRKLVPNFGVYASCVTIDGVEYQAISNLGVKPTISGEHQLGLETHILDFDGDLYGRKLQTKLRSFIRPEQKFSDLEALKQQIEKDICVCLRGAV